MTSRRLVPSVLILIIMSTSVGAQAAPPLSQYRGPLVHLPADQSAHARAANEWWYVVGHLRSGRRTFGFETTAVALRQIRLPGSQPNTPPSKIFRTDIAITDETDRRFVQHVTYYFPQSARLSSTTLDVAVGAMHLQGRSLSGMTDRASLPGGALDLSLSSRRPPMYVGGQGYLRFQGGYTYYYSLTDLATSGTLRLGGTTYRVTGTSWLDHQWGNWAWGRNGGWTWMALQLNNGVQLSVFDVHAGGKRMRAASVLPATGQLRTVGKTSISSQGVWRSPHTGTVYPSHWTVSIPPLQAALNVAPTVSDQEMRPPGTLASAYWEGSGRVSGTFQGKRVSGYSYTELVGFAGR